MSPNVMLFLSRKIEAQASRSASSGGYLNAVYRVSVSLEKQPASALMQWKSRTMSTAEGGPKRQGCDSS